MKCKYCGKKLNKQDKVCPSCGTSLIEEEPDKFGDTIRIDLDIEDTASQPSSGGSPEADAVETHPLEDISQQVNTVAAAAEDDPVEEKNPKTAKKQKPKVKEKTKKKTKAESESKVISRERSKADPSSSEKPPRKRKNYDEVVKTKVSSENVAIKAAIIVVLVLIITVAVGTFVFVHAGIKHDTSVRYNKLVEMGATTGVNKLEADPDLGKYLYVSGVTDYLPLFSEPGGEGEEVEQLANGTLVTLDEKTDRLYWLVTDFATKTQGYVSAVYLTSDPDKVIEFHNDSLESLGKMGDQGEKIEEIYYVLNAGVGVGVYSDVTLKDGSALNVLTDGNVVGLVNKVSDDVWRVYDYKGSQYGYMESKYLTDNLDALGMAGLDAADNEDEKEEDPQEEEEAEKHGPEYYVSWSESALSVRDGPTQETGNQVNRIVYGDVVEVVEETNDTFWHVYIPSLDMYGYVKAACLSPVEDDSNEE